jgi:long-chain acyl-CoA synthetase
MAEEAKKSELFPGKVLNAAETKPWLKAYPKNIPEHLEYPKVSLYERLMQSVEKYPNDIAWEFSVGGWSATYKEFGVLVDKFADALAAAGFKKGDIMTISMVWSTL